MPHLHRSFWTEPAKYILRLALLLFVALLLSATSTAEGRVASEAKQLPGAPATQDAYLFLRPSVDTPGSCPAPPNGGSTSTGCRFVLDLVLNTGSNPDATA